MVHIVCAECTRSNTPVIVGLLALSWVFTLLIHLSAQTSGGLLTSKCLVPAERSFDAFLVAMYFLQVALVMIGPNANGLSWLHLFNFNSASVLGGICLAPLDEYEKLALTLTMPLALFAQLGATAVMHWAASKVMSFQWDAYRRSVIALLLFSYMQLATVSFKYLVRFLYV